MPESLKKILAFLAFSMKREVGNLVNFFELLIYTYQN